MYIPPVQQVYHHVLAATITTTLGDSSSEMPLVLDGGGSWTLGGFVAVLSASSIIALMGPWRFGLIIGVGTIVLSMVCLLGRWSSAIGPFVLPSELVPLRGDPDLPLFVLQCLRYESSSTTRGLL